MLEVKPIPDESCIRPKLHGFSINKQLSRYNSNSKLARKKANQRLDICYKPNYDLTRPKQALLADFKKDIGRYPPLRNLGGSQESNTLDYSNRHYLPYTSPAHKVNDPYKLQKSFNLPIFRSAKSTLNTDRSYQSGHKQRTLQSLTPGSELLKKKFDLSMLESHILKSSDSKWAFGKEINDYGLKADKSVVSFNKMLSREEHFGVGDGGRIKTLSSVKTQI